MRQNCFISQDVRLSSDTKRMLEKISRFNLSWDFSLTLRKSQDIGFDRTKDEDPDPMPALKHLTYESSKGCHVLARYADHAIVVSPSQSVDLEEHLDSDRIPVRDDSGLNKFTEFLYRSREAHLFSDSIIRKYCSGGTLYCESGGRFRELGFILSQQINFAFLDKDAQDKSDMIIVIHDNHLEPNLLAELIAYASRCKCKVFKYSIGTKDESNLIIRKVW